MFGFSREEVLGLNHVDILHAQEEIVERDIDSGPPTHHSLIDKKLIHQRSKDYGSSVSSERTYRRKDGSHFIGELRCAEIIDADSGQIEHINVIIDISERIALLNEINEGKAFLNLLTQRIPNVLYLYARRVRVTFRTVVRALSESLSSNLKRSWVSDLKKARCLDESMKKTLRWFTLQPQSLSKRVNLGHVIFG
ncbi:PAS domain S-box protein [Pseudomonas sp. MAFF 301449]|uniref:PAS domain S-box protein n=1 Tax=Pseudomonas cyclaminis TaxID=2781239 RepID=A0ABR9SSL3_9PSED|nr:PAS domain S-box protein [Pseudomonas cyclaminis]MBE8591304.1 PAS domain S-box protein [Pseudomonas cyclaminis]MBE8599952.1 PAS domain S-box protein [Pseudomonas cyclaminis]